MWVASESLVLELFDENIFEGSSEILTNDSGEEIGRTKIVARPVRTIKTMYEINKNVLKIF